MSRRGVRCFQNVVVVAPAQLFERNGSENTNTSERQTIRRTRIRSGKVKRSYNQMRRGQNYHGGDQGGKIKKTVHDAAHATKAVIMHELIIEAIDGAMALYAQEAALSREQAKRLERIKAAAAQRRQEKAAEIEARHRREIAEMRAQEAARELHNSDEDSSEDEWSGGVSWGAPTTTKSPAVISSGPLKSALKTQTSSNPSNDDWGGDASWGAPVAVIAGKAGLPADGDTVARFNSSQMRISLDQLQSKAGDITVPSIRAEFEGIPRNLPRKDRLPQDTARLNSVAAVFPFAHTQVRLEPEFGKPNSNYINASYIRGPDAYPEKYIATQGPLNKDGINTIDAFWRMVVGHNVNTIVMLEDTEPYWPVRSTQDMKSGPYLLRHVGKEDKQGYIITHLSISMDSDSTSRKITHFRFKASPQDGQSGSQMLLAMMHDTRGARSGDAPLVVHDRSGSARTGAFIAIEHAILQVETMESCDIVGIVAKLREDRGGMVMSVYDYIYVHKVAAKYALAHKTGQATAAFATHERRPPAYSQAPGFGSQMSDDMQRAMDGKLHRPTLERPAERKKTVGFGI